ncbi:MAG TPA: GAF domain-containing SpoIIE family protein phosphatase [Candidatus Eisenbacteria bacterium]|jgi:sigma-B regulation protein RsbU (phosphoserine phosphatase)|nr:GAF domain-containing SpoIIE family protein phosphatase [Candidatus Eisenbacteria bacterium]
MSASGFATLSPLEHPFGHMDELAKVAALPLTGEADPVPQSLLVSFPEQAKTLGLLYDVSRELTSILDREELLRRITELVKKLVNYDVFTVMLWNEKAQMLEGVFAKHYEDSIPSRFRVPLNRGVTGHAAAARKPIRLDDVRLDSRYIDCETCEKVHSELVVPLLLQDRLIGVLDLESSQLAAFTAQHERMLVALGPFIAIALENSRLYQDARENELRLQNDLDTAREIQLQLLPRGAREVPGLDISAAYVPARELGGDFYDFLPYGEGRLALALGDVSGKGTAAALYGSLAIGMLREHAVENTAAPAVMLAMLNRRLHAARLEARFIALTFGVYDPLERTLTIANAGGTHPLLLRGGQLSEIPVDGIPLGLFPEAEYSVATLDLRVGDIIVFASDGILESENAKEEEFGFDRLRALLTSLPSDCTVDDIAGAILRATDEFAGFGNPAHDDRTMLVVRVTPDSPSDLPKLPVIY